MDKLFQGLFSRAYGFGCGFESRFSHDDITENTAIETSACETDVVSSATEKQTP
jgi:hypothetical protein